ncbi:MAG: o-succinylbenzoate--CoA ligase [Bacteroidetes bacterium]|nr:o-succinylbenzoate--CoA ligase [Bacteroidota bacterium]
MSVETILCPVRVNTESRPDVPALITSEKTWSWAELDELVSSTAAHLNEMAPPGSRIAVQMPNSPELVALILAALRTGHVLALISTRLPENDVETARKQIRADLFTNLSHTPTRPHAHTQDIPSPPHPLTTSPSDPLGARATYISPLPHVTILPIPLTRPATITYTSGSAGTPKAALHTVGSHVWSARGLAEALPLAQEDRWLLNLPLYHVSGLAIVYRCALAGAAVVLPGHEMSTGEAIRAFGVTHSSLVAAQLYRLLREDFAVNTLKAILLGGSAISPGLLAAASERSLPIHTSYGLTEMASTVSVTSAFISTLELASSGRPLPHRELAIRDGEIQVRGRTRFTGYVEGKQLIQPFDDQGWFATGDLGYMDETGCLHVAGRTDNQFVSGGENIQPEEIEAALNALSGVVQAIVVPVADDEFGQRPVAFVQMEDELDPQAIRTSLEATLPRFKLPVAIYPWPTLAGMKPSRTALQREAEVRNAR